MDGGSRHIHGISAKDGGVKLTSGANSLVITPIDAPIVNLGKLKIYMTSAHKQTITSCAIYRGPVCISDPIEHFAVYGSGRVLSLVGQYLGNKLCDVCFCCFFVNYTSNFIISSEGIREFVCLLVCFFFVLRI